MTTVSSSPGTGGWGEGPEVLLPYLDGLPDVDTYLTIDGVTGSATDQLHEDWIEVQSFSWGISTAAPAVVRGSGRRRGRSALSALAVRTRLDASGPELFRAAAQGRAFPSAVVECADAGRPVSLVIELKNVTVSSYRLASVGTTPVQVFDLHAERLEFTHRTLAEDGSTRGEVSHAWDVQQA
ncbi:MAG: type VI secretion system tube protein Hcp [Ornithinibacter sp.]